MEKRPYPPGQHGRTRRRGNVSEYLLQLQEKQKARFTYGMTEKQFRRLYEEASGRPGVTGETLLVYCELRVDNVVYRSGFAQTRRQARQLVVHGHFLVNGRKVNVPSYRVGQYDIIDVKPKSQNLDVFVIARELHHERVVPAWLTVKPNKGRILVHQLPTRDQIVVDVTEQLIVELYSK